ncbi:MAG TPA: hypothetical protein VIH81_02960 [Roseiarcus sp.]
MANDATFGGPTFNSDVGFNIDLSDDKQAFTALFSGLVAIIDGKGAVPIVTRSFSFSLPLSGAKSGSVIPFFVGGFAFTEAGANGHLLFSVNEQTLVVDFPENSNDSFLRQLNYTVGTAAELRITVFILADRDSKSDAAVNLTVSSIDTDINKHTAPPTS